MMEITAGMAIRFKIFACTRGKWKTKKENAQNFTPAREAVKTNP
jgi:hypothetical protein